MIPLEFTSRTGAPWLFVTHGRVTQDDIPKHILFLELDAVSMTNLDGMYRGFVRAFEFPDYFGFNYNALDECLNDLEWLPAKGYLLFIRNADHLLKEESDEVLEGLLSILDSTGKEWATPITGGNIWDRPAIPFHTIFELKDYKISRIVSSLERLGIMFQELNRVD